MTSMPVARFLSCILVALAAEAASAQSGRTPRSDPDDVFRRLDGDGDGRLTATELRSFPGARRVPDLLQRLDRDGDGSLAPAEFRAITSMAGKAARRWSQRARPRRSTVSSPRRPTRRSTPAFACSS
jgi:hypothetical protein